jgi:biotin carboxyl carrier protein
MLFDRRQFARVSQASSFADRLALNPNATKVVASRAGARVRSRIFQSITLRLATAGAASKAQLKHGALDEMSRMKRISHSDSLATAVALGGLVSQMSPATRTVLTWTCVHEKTSTRAELASAKDVSTPSESMGDAPECLIRMPPEQIAAQEIDVAPVEKGVLARQLTVPGTITLNMDMVARVPARVVGTVTQMRKRLGDLVTQGDVVAVLDSREVADAKSEYLTASVAFDLQKTLLERAGSMGPFLRRAAVSSGAETFLEAELETRPGPAKLSALNSDPAEVATAAKKGAPNAGASSLREYQIRSSSAGGLNAKSTWIIGREPAILLISIPSPILQGLGQSSWRCLRQTST